MFKPVSFFLIFTMMTSVALAKIDRFIKVDDGFYRGGQPATHADYVRLQKLGVKTILNLRENPELSAAEKRTVESLGMNYINIPFSTFDYPTPEKMKMVMDLVKNENVRPIFVHCRHGKDRTGIVGVLYRVQVQKWPVQKAYDEALALNIRWYLPSIPMLIKRETGVMPSAFGW